MSRLRTDKLKTDVIESINGTGSNITLSDDGTTTFNGPILNSGSSNLIYPYKQRGGETVIPVPDWATTIEIDFYNFQCTSTATYYSIIGLILANSNSPASDFRMTYSTITANQGYAANVTGSGRWGSASGQPSSSLVYLFQNTGGTNYVYDGTLKMQKVPFVNESTGGTNNIYYMDLTASYTFSTDFGSFWYNGYIFGAGNDPTDVLESIVFGNNSNNDTHFGQFNARFRQEDPGTIVT